MSDKSFIAVKGLSKDLVVENKLFEEDNELTAMNNFILKTVMHRKEKYNTYIHANLNRKKTVVE